MQAQESEDLFGYYDERALEYDEIYIGRGPCMPHPDIYAKDVAAITSLCARHGSGHLVDIGCGTGFWLPHYGPNCREITLIDQSQKMLAMCQARAAQLDSTIKVNYVKGNFFELRFLTETFNSALVAFFIGHLNEEQENVFFNRMKKLLEPGARVLWIDGSWSEIRRQYREKEGIQSRILRNGRRFEIFKKYFTNDEIVRILNTYALEIVAIYVGDVFFAAQAELMV